MVMEARAPDLYKRMMGKDGATWLTPLDVAAAYCAYVGVEWQLVAPSYELNGVSVFGSDQCQTVLILHEVQTYYCLLGNVSGDDLITFNGYGVRDDAVAGGCCDADIDFLDYTIGQVREWLCSQPGKSYTIVFQDEVCPNGMKLRDAFETARLTSPRLATGDSHGDSGGDKAQASKGPCRLKSRQ